MKSKKEKAGEDLYNRTPVFQFIAPPKTPTASKLRKDAQAKASAAEKVVVEKEVSEEMKVKR
jgi:hypothetical protein